MTEDFNQSLEFEKGPEFDPEEYVLVCKAEAKGLRKLYKTYDCALKILETKLFAITTECTGMLEDRNPIHTVQTRLKSAASLVEKLKRRGFPRTVESMTLGSKAMLSTDH